MILAIVDDLFFREKLVAAAGQLGRPLVFAKNPDSALSDGAAFSRVLIDLNLSSGDPIAIVRRLREANPAIPVIGYCSHTQGDLRKQALEAGCTRVLPRSQFVQQLPELLSD